MFLNIKTFKHSNNQIIHPYNNYFIFQTNASKCFRKIIMTIHFQTGIVNIKFCPKLNDKKKS